MTYKNLSKLRIMTDNLLTTNNKMVPPNNISEYLLEDFKTLNTEGYTTLRQLEETCGGLDYFPKTSKIVLDDSQCSQLLYNLDQYVPKLDKTLEISPEAVNEKSIEFFSNKAMVVQPKGIQGIVYKTVMGIQNSVPMHYTYQAVSVIKTTNITGAQIITKAPLTFVGATYIGSVFFGYCGGIAGNTSVGRILNFTSFILSRPMRGVEITLNGLFLGPVSNIIGLPLVLNGTQELLVGKRLPIEEYAKIGASFERITNSNCLKKIYKIIRNRE